MNLKPNRGLSALALAAAMLGGNVVALPRSHRRTDWDIDEAPDKPPKPEAYYRSDPSKPGGKFRLYDNDGLEIGRSRDLRKWAHLPIIRNDARAAITKAKGEES